MTAIAAPDAPAPDSQVRASRLFARLSLAATMAVAALLVLLHPLKPDFAPSWRFLSEYAIGPHGWVMMLAFELWAASLVLLAMALCGEVTSRAGRAGRIVLLVVANALVVAGLFAQDPVTSAPDEQTISGMVHALASMVGVPGTPLAALLVSVSLTRTNPAWAPYRTGVMAAASLTAISLAVMALYLLWAVPQAGGFTPQVWAGWMNRLVVASYLLWQGLLAYRLQGMAR